MIGTDPSWLLLTYRNIVAARRALNDGRLNVAGMIHTPEVWREAHQLCEQYKLDQPYLLNDTPIHADLLEAQRHSISIETVLPVRVSLVLPSPCKKSKFREGLWLEPLASWYPFYRALYRAGVRQIDVLTDRTQRSLPCHPTIEDMAGRHAGQRAFVLGNGPSLNKVDMSVLHGEVSFGANQVYHGFSQWGFATPYWGCIDRLQIERHGEEFCEALPDQVIKFVPFEYATIFHAKNVRFINLMYGYPGQWRQPRFSADLDRLYLGYTITHTLLQIAAGMGCDPIVLLGCDHNFPLWPRAGKQSGALWKTEDAKGPTHFSSKYTKNREFVRPRPEQAEKAFDAANRWARDASRSIVNASPGTKLRSFPRVGVSDFSRTHTPPPSPNPPLQHPLAVVTSGNDAQLPMLLSMVRTLRDPFLGDFSGPVLLLSDHLSEAPRLWLEDVIGVKTILLNREFMRSWKRDLASQHPWGKVGKFFLLEHACHMLEGQAEKMAFLDPDTLIQRPIAELMQSCHDGRVVIGRQHDPMNQTRGGGPVQRLTRAVTAGLVSKQVFDQYPHELNTGFMAGPRNAVARLCIRVMDFQLRHPSFASIGKDEADAWHDQDYFRLWVRLFGEDDLQVVGPETCAHLCAGAHARYQLDEGGLPLRNRDDGCVPYVMHFAGATHVQFPEIEALYQTAGRDIQDAIGPNQVTPIACLSRRVPLNQKLRTAHHWIIPKIRQIVAMRVQRAQSQQALTNPNPNAGK